MMRSGGGSVVGLASCTRFLGGFFSFFFLMMKVVGGSCSSRYRSPVSPFLPTRHARTTSGSPLEIDVNT
jgi:hypothetical protein